MIKNTKTSKALVKTDVSGSAMIITGFIKDPFTHKRIDLATIKRVKGDSLLPDKIGIRWLRKYLIFYKKEFSGFLRREHGFISHKLSLGIEIKHYR